MNRKHLSYWIPTGIFCAILTFSGIAHFTHAAPMVEGMTHLGYPLYVMTILGIAKVSGVVALLIPGKPVLKEWAYAGFTFNLIGATASHAFAGDAISHILTPAAILCLGVVSYALRPESRRLITP